MSKISKRILFVIITIVSLFISCGQPKSEWGGSVEEIDGVTVVKNPKEPIYGEDVLTLEEDLVLGAEEHEGEPLFFAIRTFKVDEAENIYVLDNKAHKIKVFDKAGQLIRSFGEKGEGPGELERPTNMELYPENQIIVFNFGGRKLTLFSRDGDFIKDLPFEKLGRIFRMRVDSQGKIYGYSITREKDVQKTIIKKYDSNLNFISDIVTIEEKIDYTTVEAEPALLYFHVINDNLVWGHAVEYVLHVVDPDGNEIQRISRDYDPVKYTQEDKEKAKEEFGDMLPENIKIKFPDTYPPFVWFYPSIDGGIVVRTNEKTANEAYYCDFFNSEGKYIAKIPFKFLPRAFKNGKVYFAEEDEEGYQLIKRYKATWNF